MPEAYCVKCRTKRLMMAPNEQVLKNQRRALVGVCPTCGTKLVRFLSSES
ncbi:MAG: DUF5679 domain-containing protein [Candidatus Geothermarchaeales archaeon]